VERERSRAGGSERRLWRKEFVKETMER